MSILTTLFCLGIVLGIRDVVSIRVLRSDMSLNQEGQFLTGAKLINTVGNFTLKSFAICVRFKFKILGSGFDRSNVLVIENKPRVGRMFKIGAMYPRTSFVFGYPQQEGSFVTQTMQNPTNGAFNIFKTDIWTHVCASFDKDTNHLIVVKDGQTLNINFTHLNIYENQYPADFLNHVYLGRCINKNPACSAPEGEYSDLNMWKRPLTEQELIDWTSCRLFKKGDLINWNTARFDIINMTYIERPMTDLCQPQRPGTVIFPEPKTFYDHVDLCYQMRGVPTILNSDEEREELSAVINQYKTCQTSRWNNFWTGWWDEPQEGVMSKPVTGELMTEDDYAPFKMGQPNGFDLENCMLVHVQRKAYNDQPCDSKLCGFCSLEESPRLQIRGLCKDSGFDTEYSWAQYLLNKRHYFRGYTASKIFWDNITDVWTMDVYKDETKKAFTAGEQYPFGTKKWTFENGQCGENETVLSLNACSEEEFNCNNGYCIDIYNRCDGKTDCPDMSDEVDCQIYSLQVSYLKDVPPPPLSLQKRKNEIDVSVRVRNILDIEEVDGLIGMQFELDLTWYDSRLTFYNLKHDSDLNTLTSNERQDIWIPQVVFDNTKDKVESLNDEKAFITAQKQGRFKRAAVTELQNAYIYKGKENPLTIHRVYSQNFLCEFDMVRYPFDTQRCKIKLVMKGNSGKFTELLPGKLEYSGPIDLVQYFVKDYTIINKTISTGQKAICVNLVFGRRVLSTVLTTYLPMIVLCLVAFSTNYFKAFFFEAIVTVNLTALLVQTTLFVSISESLPKTNYIKMLDVWCIFNLFVPFCEVIIQTYMDQLRDDQNRAVNHHGQTVNVGTRRKSNYVNALKVDPVPTKVTSKPAESYPTELVAREEVKEIKSRYDFYNEVMVTTSPRKMRIAQIVAKVVFPVTYFCFIICFFGIGMHYYNADDI